MPKLLIIADDLTGALDTGVKFSEAGIKTAVYTRRPENEAGDEEVTVLCADTRHLPHREAYREIRSIVEQNRERFPYIMKKTDSGLRGNIGAELQAVLDGAGEACLAFLPALPEMDRITRGGVHYINGVPVSQSVFGRDPFDPVTEDDIPRLLRRQCASPVRVVARGAEAEPAGADPVIDVYDAETAEDMRLAVSRILRGGSVRLLAGCAGLAQALARELSGGFSAPCPTEEKEPLLVVCGSVNRISQLQLEYAEKAGVARVHLPLDYLLGDEAESPLTDAVIDRCSAGLPLMVDTLAETTSECPISPEELEDRRYRISHRLGGLVKIMMDRGITHRIMIIGGDTLLALMEAAGCTALTPVCEVDRGVVLFTMEYRGHTYRIMSKSGGFGSEDLLTRI